MGVRNIYTVIVLANENVEATEGPSFEFETMFDVVNFITLCFKNGYDVAVMYKEEEQTE